jgi:DNA-binding protein H-NS
MARRANLDKMKLSQLNRLLQDVEEAIKLKRDEMRAQLRDEFMRKANEIGIALDEVVGRRKAKGSVPIKYRDPANPQNTWTGRGRTPIWLAKAIKNGKKREDYLI